MKIIHFNQLVELNALLKQHGYDYTIHAAPGCSTYGAILKGTGEVVDSLELCNVINDYLKDKWMSVEPISKGSYELIVK